MKTENWYKTANSGVRLVFAGLPHDSEIQSLGITTFAADDYLLRLILDDESLASFCDSEERLDFVPSNSQELREILGELVGCLRKRGIEIASSKRYLDLVRAILGFRFSMTGFAQRMLRRSPPGKIDSVLGTVRDQINNDPPFA